MYILYICILAPFIQIGFSLIGEETDLNSLSGYETVDDFKENFEIWNTDNRADVVFDSLSRLQLEEICKNSDSLVYITQEDITIDCEAFNDGDQPIDTTKKIIKRSVDDEDEGSGDEPVISNNKEDANDQEAQLKSAPESLPVDTAAENNSETKKADETFEQETIQLITTVSVTEEKADNEPTAQETIVTFQSVTEKEKTDNELPAQEASLTTPESEIEITIATLAAEEKKSDKSLTEQETTHRSEPSDVPSTIGSAIPSNEDNHDEQVVDQNWTIESSTTQVPTEHTTPLASVVEQTEKQKNKETNVEEKTEPPQEDSKKENDEENEKGGDKLQNPNDENNQSGSTEQPWEKKDVKELGGRALNFPEKSQKMQVEDTNDQSGNTGSKKAGSKDTTILVFLFVAVVVVGALAFAYNFIKKRKRQSADLERVERVTTTKLSSQSLHKADTEPEKKPLMSDSKEVEMVNMKKENSTSDQTPETAPSESTVKT